MKTIVLSGVLLVMGVGSAFVGTHRASRKVPAGIPTTTPVPTESIPTGTAVPNERIARAIKRGLEYLEKSQDRSGGWVQDIGFKFNDRYEVTVSGKSHVGVSALALMAFLSGGHIPGRGRYGDVVRHGTDFILAAVDDDTGYISASETRMYSHAFCTLYLAEIYGMTRRTDLRTRLQNAVDLTVKTQNVQGSWRYRPYAPDSDMSIAVCQLMALRAARNIGIHVPRSNIDRAYDYIQRSAYQSGPRKGAFRYQIDQPSTRISFALCAAGLASLHNAGFYEDAMIEPGIRWLRRNMQRFGRNERYRSYFYWYGQYYAAQVMFTAADRDPALWNDFYWPQITKELLEHQEIDGSWSNAPGPGSAFATAVACIILQIPYQYLPIFQR